MGEAAKHPQQLLQPISSFNLNSCKTGSTPENYPHTNLELPLPQPISIAYSSNHHTSIIYHLLEFRHYACSSIQLVRFFVTLIFTYFVAYHDAFNSSPSRIGCFITKEGAS